MSKFNNATKVRRPAVKGFIKTKTSTTPVPNHEGAEGVERKAKSELFLLAVADFVNEGSFYEGASDRTERLVSLARKVAVKDLTWTTEFVDWLRDQANMRSSALVIALEGAYALNKKGIPGGRDLVRAALRRADEPGEAVAYWHANHGRKMPKSVKRGIADAAKELYTQRAVGKYDTSSKAVRFGDVLSLTHPKPDFASQNALFKYALDRRYDSQAEVPEILSILKARRDFFNLDSEELKKIASSTDILQEWVQRAALNWEDVAGAAPGGLSATVWEALIPNMGYMALIRNLRNFTDAGVSNRVLDEVSARLSDEYQVARSRQLPFRFFSAYKATQHSLEFSKALERGLTHSLKNVPELKGRTLVLVDRSGSMFWSHSQNSSATQAETAALFGSAIALQAEDATLVEFGTYSNEVPFRKGGSVLTLMNQFTDLGGTNTAEAVNRWYNDHDRVIVVTDEQSWGGDPYRDVPSEVPVYTWNVVGYRTGTLSDANRFTFGGLSDSAFRLIPLLEAGSDADWPWRA